MSNFEVANDDFTQHRANFNTSPLVGSVMCVKERTDCLKVFLLVFYVSMCERVGVGWMGFGGFLLTGTGLLTPHDFRRCVFRSFLY